MCRISFSTHRAGRKILWKQAKRLTPGSIVALSTDNFQSDCRVATIAQRPIEGGLDQNPPTVDITWSCPEEAVVDPDQELVMVEPRSGFYEAARHAMIGLQLAAGEVSSFDKYLLRLDNHDSLCRHIYQNPLVDLSCLVTQLTPEQQQQAMGSKDLERIISQQVAEQYQECDMARPLSKQGIQPQTSLDSSQLQALQRMVSKELAVVQGPPGTGKTFTSVQALRAILDNRRPSDPPVIVAAQTNHALDQLLIYCHSAGAKILRVGGRTENEVIKERTVYNLRQSLGKDAQGDGRAKYRSLEKERLQIVENFKTLVEGVFGGQGLLDPQALLDAGVINEAQFQSLSNEGWEDDDEPAMQAWLSEERIERLRQPPEEIKFTEEEAIDEQFVDVDPDLEDETVDEKDDRLFGTWIPLTSYFTGTTPRFPGWQARCVAMLAQKDDLYKIPVPLRGGVYQILQSKLREASTAKLREILQQAVSHGKRQKVNKWFSDLIVLEKHCINIIGCTTTGLTKYRGFLAATGARVLLIEEAAETREPNVTSALFSSLDQLILVGDHQQLPPQCDIARLGGEPFNLNVSLFERLVSNRVPYTMLNRQRRMAPELRYIVQQYYPDLKDHPIVKDNANRPLIPGMGSRRSWFFTHEWPEETDSDNSKFNHKEAEMIVAFMKYLIQNGVRPTEITVLTYYRGQRKRLLNLLRRPRESLSLGACHFNVATVDSYQGEENEIVLLSLVRSPPTPNDAKRVGFVESLNRATVAISRARRGFFMFGNKENLFKSTTQSFDTWGPVWNGFAEQRRVAMGKGLPLVCQNHADEQNTNEIWMKSPESFVGNAGGCWIKCHAKLPCGHDCVLNCHV
jgi:helicase required for RNAi-mediated heterochromatin assembly 1